MNIEDPRWDTYEKQFRALADELPHLPEPYAELVSSPIVLCLYGENGLEPDQEFEVLQQLETAKAEGQSLRCVTMTTAYWEDLVLFVDPPTDS